MRVASFDTSQDGLADEHRLIVAAQQGDRLAFAQLVERYWDRLYRWLYRLTRDQHTAEDLVQESFLKAFAGLKKFQAGTNFRAWLFCIAHNNYANQCRASAHRRQPLPEDVPDSQYGPLEEAISAELLQDLGRAIQRLPTEFRAALLLRVEEGLSFRQIAEVLDLTEETARWRVFKARQKLLSLLAPRREQRSEARSPRAEDKKQADF
jgi:RNA polymerase sigma-70 factor (ECF subfamily)